MAMIRRVSSRQRLVSWEEFQATTISSDSDGETYGSCPQFVLSDSNTTSFPSTVATDHHPQEEDSITTLKRKRRLYVRRSSLNNRLQLFKHETEPHVIPLEEPNDLSNLPQEVQLGIMQFLEVRDLRSIAQVNRSSWQLLSTPESVEALWKPECFRKWPWLVDQRKDTSLNLVDAFRVGNNYSVLLALAAEHVAVKIDESLFLSTRWSRSLRAYRPRRSSSSNNLQMLGDSVQFVGEVGVGDRSIRANAPLPRPHLCKRNNSSSGGKSLFSRLRTPPILCRTRHAQQPQSIWKPFCVPFVGRDGADGADFFLLTPRLVSYYEVSILPLPPTAAVAVQTRPPTRPHRMPLERITTTTAPVTECVAVGLATADFTLHCRMPGWDAHSFGYHGDDGGIFHAAGSMLKEYGSRFGVGDTVGCGVDYHRTAIFYTLNGTFQGYAFDLKDEHLLTDLYPVVGMDTSCPVACNFGVDRPFRFDLAGMIAKHATIVTPVLPA